MPGTTGPAEALADDWARWAGYLLDAIGAPRSQTNYDTLWRWRLKEGTRARWNYLATTQDAPDATVLPGNSAGVKEYPTLAVGAGATAQTLQSGLYNDILTMLKNAVPGPEWTPDARYELDTWAHGPRGAHGTDYPNFLGGKQTAPAGNQGGGASQDQGFLGIPGAIRSVQNDLVRYAYFMAGLALIGGGLALLALLVLKGAAPAVAAAATGASVPGRALRVLKGGKMAGVKAKPPKAEGSEPEAPVSEDEERAALRAEMAHGIARPKAGAAYRARAARKAS
jgi:hypothetical protein